MRTKNLLAIILLFNAVSAFSQTILKEGDLTYIMDSNGTIQSKESIGLTKESYYEIYINGFPRYPMDAKKVFRTIFSKERALELGKNKYRISCDLQFDGIKQRLCYISFRNIDGIDMPLTLNELYKVEKIFKSFKYTYTVTYKTKIDRFTNVHYLIDFISLYKDD